MDALSLDLVLETIKKMDILTILKLRRSNKSYKCFIDAHKSSILKERLEDLTGSCPALTTNVLSSELYLRRSLTYGTFEMVHEVEKRTIRIDEILRNSTLIDLTSFPGMQALDLHTQNRLYALFKRALFICDSIADIATQVAPMNEQNYAIFKASSFNQGRPPIGFREMDPAANPRARSAQQAIINNLDLGDTAVLYYLINSLGAAYRDSIQKHHPDPEIEDFYNSDPRIQEKTVVFEENTLRHGSWYIHAKTCKDVGWGTMGEKVDLSAMMELERYEEGEEGVGPSLKAALLGQFKKLVGKVKNPIDMDMVALTMQKVVFGAKNIEY